FGAEGHVLDSGDLEMHLSHAGQLLDVVVVGQKTYQRPASEVFWEPTTLAALRSRQGALSALDTLRLSRLANQLHDARMAGQQQFAGRTVDYYELVFGPPPGAQSLQSSSEQLVVMEGTIQLWASSDDGLIQLPHLQ